MKPKTTLSAWSFMDAIRSRNGVPPLPEDTICSSKCQQGGHLKRLWIIVHDLDHMNLKSIKDWIEDDFHNNGETQDVYVLSFKASLVLEKGTHISERELLAERLIRGIHRVVSEKEPSRVVFLGCGDAALTLALALSGGSMNNNSISERVRDILSSTVGILLAPLFIEADNGLNDVVGKLQPIVDKRVVPPALERFKNTHIDSSSNADALKALRGVVMKSVVSILNHQPVPRPPTRVKTHPPRNTSRFRPKRVSTDPHAFSTLHQESSQARADNERRLQQLSRHSTAPPAMDVSHKTESPQTSNESNDIQLAPPMSSRPAPAMTRGKSSRNALEEEKVAGYYFEKWDLSSAKTWYTKARHQLPQDAPFSRYFNIDVSIASTLIRLGEFKQASRTLNAILKSTRAHSSLKLESVIAQCQSMCCATAVTCLETVEHLNGINEQYRGLKRPLLTPEKVQMALNIGCIASLRLFLGEYKAAEEAASESVRMWESMLQQPKSKTSAGGQLGEPHTEMRLITSVATQDLHGGSIGLQCSQSLPSVRRLNLNIDYDSPHSTAKVEHSTEAATKSLLDSQFRLAKINTELGHIDKAFHLNEAVLDRMKIFWGPNHVVTLRTANLRSRLLLLREDFSEAEVTCKNAWRLVADRLGSEHYIALDFVGTLVKIHIARGRWREAHEFAENLVVRNRTTLGENHPQAIESEIDFAHILDVLGKTTTAGMLQKTVHEKSRIVLGEHHPTTLICRSRLASVYCNAAKWEDAFDQVKIVHTSLKEAIIEGDFPSISTVTARKIIGSVARTLACHHRAEAELMSNIYRKMKSKPISDYLFGISEEQLEIAKEFHRKAFGEDHAEFLSTQFELHLVKRDKEEELDEELLKSLSNILKQSSIKGRSHIDTSTMQYELALTYASIEKWEDANTFGSAALSSRIQAFGKLHPDVLRSKLHLSSVLWCSGKTDAATQHLRDAHDTICAHQNELPAFDIFSIKRNLANMLVETGDFERAVLLQEQVVDQAKKTMKDDNLLACQNDLAFIYQKLKRFEDARRQYDEMEKSLDNRQSFSVQGADTFRMVHMSGVVSLYMEQQKYAKAEQLQRELKRTLKAHPSYGKHNKDTITCRYNLALILKKQGKVKEAKDQLKKALSHMENVDRSEHIESKEMRRKLREWS